ncbi:MAG: PIN domain-containing protein [Parvularculaceae bacterium]
MTAQPERVFLDTNIALYLVRWDAVKTPVAQSILRSPSITRVISTQVLSEFVNVSRKKAGLSWEEVRRDAGHLRSLCRVDPVTEDVIEEALGLGAVHQFSWYDAVVVASALSAGANRLLTEDMQDGRKFGAMTIVNPF